MATFLKTKNRIQAQVRLRGVKIFKTFSDKKSARAWATNKEIEIMRGKKYEVDKSLMTYLLGFIFFLMVAIHLENLRQFRDIKNKLNDIYNK